MPKFKKLYINQRVSDTMEWEWDYLFRFKMSYDTNWFSNRPDYLNFSLQLIME